jgi:hypothetical protein
MTDTLARECLAKELDIVHFFGTARRVRESQEKGDDFLTVDVALKAIASALDSRAPVMEGEIGECVSDIRAIRKAFGEDSKTWRRLENAASLLERLAAERETLEAEIWDEAAQIALESRDESDARIAVMDKDTGLMPDGSGVVGDPDNAFGRAFEANWLGAKFERHASAIRALKGK